MFAIVVPGKVSAMSVCFASATEALTARWPIGAFDLSEIAKTEAETNVLPSS